MNLSAKAQQRKQGVFASSFHLSFRLTARKSKGGFGALHWLTLAGLGLQKEAEQGKSFSINRKAWLEAWQ